MLPCQRLRTIWVVTMKISINLSSLFTSPCRGDLSDCDLPKALLVPSNSGGVMCMLVQYTRAIKINTNRGGREIRSLVLLSPTCHANMASRSPSSRSPADLLATQHKCALSHGTQASPLRSCGGQIVRHMVWQQGRRATSHAAQASVRQMDPGRVGPLTHGTRASRSRAAGGKGTHAAAKIASRSFHSDAYEICPLRLHMNDCSRLSCWLCWRASGR